MPALNEHQTTVLMEALIDRHLDIDTYDDWVFGIVYAPDQFGGHFSAFGHGIEYSIKLELEKAFDLLFVPQFGNHTKWSSEEILSQNILHGRHAGIAQLVADSVPLATDVFTESDTSLLYLCLSELGNVDMNDVYFYQYHWSKSCLHKRKVRADNLGFALNNYLQYDTVDTGSVAGIV